MVGEDVCVPTSQYGIVVAAREELNRRGERKRNENAMMNAIIEERERERE